MNKEKSLLPATESCAGTGGAAGQPRLCMKCGVRHASRMTITNKGGKQYRCESCASKKGKKGLK